MAGGGEGGEWIALQYVAIISNTVKALHNDPLYNEVSGLIKNNSPQPGLSYNEMYSCMERNQGPTKVPIDKRLI